jgi:hypothetical protein
MLTKVVAAVLGMLTKVAYRLALPCAGQHVVLVSSNLTQVEKMYFVTQVASRTETVWSKVLQ